MMRMRKMSLMKMVRRKKRTSTGKMEKSQKVNPIIKRNLRKKRMMKRKVKKKMRSLKPQNLLQSRR